MERLVVIGGDAAGMSAAAQARRRRGAEELEVVAFERGRFTSYSACGIPYWLGGVVDDRDQLIARSPDEHRERGIDVRLRHERWSASTPIEEPSRSSISTAARRCRSATTI